MRPGDPERRHTPTMPLRRAPLVLLVALAVAGSASGCSSSSKSSTPPTDANGSCPFSGSTQPTSQPGVSGPTTVVAATPQTDGCIDNVTLKFSPTLAASNFAYQSSGPVLDVTLTGASLGSGLSSGTTQNPKNLNHVKQLVVTAESGNVKVAITLDEKRPYVVSASKVPAQIELSIG
jgi:hypothetical protein